MKELNKKELIDLVEKMIDCDKSTFNYFNTTTGNLITHGVEITLASVIMTVSVRLLSDDIDFSNYSYHIVMNYTHDRFTSNGDVCKVYGYQYNIDEMEFNRLTGLVNNKAIRTTDDIIGELNSYFRDTKLSKIIN